MQRLAEFLLVVLAPMIVALVIYKIAPARAAVTGPFKGVNLNLQGAFAGCFAFMLLIFSFHDKLLPPPRYEVWSVDGKIEYDDEDPAKVADQTKLVLDPRPRVLENGSFQALFTVKPGVADNNLEFPALCVDLDDQQHDPLVLYLDGKPRSYETDQYEVLVDRKAKAIHIAKPLRLRRKTPAPGNHLAAMSYNAGGAEIPQPTTEH